MTTVCYLKDSMYVGLSLEYNTLRAQTAVLVHCCVLCTFEQRLTLVVRGSAVGQIKICMHEWVHEQCLSEMIQSCSPSFLLLGFYILEFMAHISQVAHHITQRAVCGGPMRRCDFSHCLVGGFLCRQLELRRKGPPFEPTIVKYWVHRLQALFN